MEARAVRVGISPCPNDVFIFAGLILGATPFPDSQLTFDYQDVETLNAAARRGVYDVVKISYAAYASIKTEYELLECGGALGRGVGPLLLSNGDPTFDPTQEILIPGEYTTAHFLLNFYAQYATPNRPFHASVKDTQSPNHSLQKRFLPFDALYAELCNLPGAQGVVIHENRFTYERDNLILLQDLGAFWEAQTGHAIPLGAIAVRRGSDLDKPMTTAIQASLNWAEAHPDEALVLCRQHAQTMDDAVLKAHISLYVNEYTRNLGDEGREAVQFFLNAQREFAAGST